MALLLYAAVYNISVLILFPRVHVNKFSLAPIAWINAYAGTAWCHFIFIVKFSLTTGRTREQVFLLNKWPYKICVIHICKWNLSISCLTFFTVLISCFSRIVLVGEPCMMEYSCCTQTHLAGKILFVMLAICIKHAAPGMHYSCSFYIEINVFLYIVVCSNILRHNCGNFNLN